MGDHSGLSLHHFGHIFEVFACYYLLLGTNKAFHNYFNLSVLFRNWPATLQEKKTRITTIQGFLENWVTTITFPSNENNFFKQIFILIKHWKRLRKKSQLNNQALKINKLLIFLDFHLDSHFKEKSQKIENGRCDECGKHKCGNCGVEKLDKDSETDFHKFITPYYIYFGTLSVSLLVYCGIYEKWKMMNNLQFVNIITLVILIVLAMRLFQNKYYYKKFDGFDPLNVFGWSIFGLFVSIIVPHYWVDVICIIPNLIPEYLITLNDLQIMGVVALVLLPVVLHLTFLCRIVHKHKKMEKLYSKLISGGVETSDFPEILPTNKLPNLS